MKHKSLLERCGAVLLAVFFAVALLFALGVFERSRVVVIAFTDGAMTYEGEWLQDAFTGEGTLRFGDGAAYSGGFADSRFHGYGVYSKEGWDLGGVFTAGVLTEPEYISIPDAGIRVTVQTEYIITSRDYIYTGPMENWLPHGEGVYAFTDGSAYSGYLQNGLAEGYGVLKNAEGTPIYEGLWSRGLPHGAGTYYDASGNAFRAVFEHGYPTEAPHA